MSVPRFSAVDGSSPAGRVRRTGRGGGIAAVLGSATFVPDSLIGPNPCTRANWGPAYAIQFGFLAVLGFWASARSRRIGYLPQHFEPHWDLTAAQLVELGAHRLEGLGRDAIHQVLTAHALDDLADRRWSTLSGGERARVLLAMVLVADPPILLADEPAAALDIRHRLDVAGLLAARGNDRLSVVVVHDLDLAFRFFDRVVVLHRGRVVADGTAGDLLHDARLDAAFGVRFERIATSAGYSLVATGQGV